MKLTPAETAQHDQEQAVVRDEVYTYVETARAMTAKVGVQQSVSNLYVLLQAHGASKGIDEAGLRVLLSEALQMLADAGVRAPWAVSDAG